jgi:hypothetical protein
MMRRSLLIVAAGLAILAAAPLAAAIPLQAATPVTVHVTPGTGGPRTTFTVSLRNPSQTGTMDTLERFDELNISGPRRSGCVGSGTMTLPIGAPNQVIRVALSPTRMGNGLTRNWCTGTFHGSVVQTVRFICAPPRLCPTIAVRPQTIGRFGFRVQRRS